MNLLMLLGHEPPKARETPETPQPLPAAKPARRNYQRDAIKLLLADGRWHSTSAIHAHLVSVSPRTVLKTNVSHALDRLRDQGEVLQSRYGHAESNWKKSLLRQLGAPS